MASNIQVAITVDNKQYIAGVKAADAATKQFANDTDKSLGKVGTSFDAFTRKVGGLKTILTGLAFGAVGRSALQMADSLQDLSNSSGIAVNQLLELKKALETSGGEADSMPQAINTLLRSIDEAAGGSIKAQNAFMKLGVSLTDLGALSERDLLINTLKGIAALPTATERATAMMQNFGKSFKTVNAQELLDKLTATAGSADKYAASIERAAKLNDQLATAQGNLKLAFLEAFSGPLLKITDFNDKVNEGTAKMDGLITAIKAVGIALATVFAVTGALALATFIGQIGRALSVITGLGAAFTTGGKLAAMGGFFAATGAFMVGLRGVLVLLAALGTSIYAASQLFDDFASIAVNALSRVMTSLGQLVGEILNLPTDALADFLKIFTGIEIKNPMGLGTPFIEAAKLAKQAREETEKTQKALNARRAFAATDERRVKPDTPAGREVDTTARAQAIAGVKEITAEYEKQQRLNLQRLNLETQLVGKSEEEKQLREAQNQLAQQYSDVQDQLIKKRQSLGKEEQYLAATINAEIKKNAEGFNKQFEALTQSITAQQTAKMLEEDRKRTMDNITKSMEQQLKIQEALTGQRLSLISQGQDVAFAGSKIGKGSLQQQFMDIAESNRKAGLEASRAFAAAFEDGGDGLTPERAKQLQDGLDAIAMGYRSITDAQMANLAESRTWSAAWTSAFQTYRDEAYNAAEQIKTYFDTFTKGFEDAFVKMVQTGKLSFKDLANSLIADFARIQAKKALLGIFDMGGANSSGQGFSFGTLFGSIGKLFGFANGGNPPVGRPSIVGERGPELFVPKSAGTIVPAGQFGGGGNVTNVNYSISAVDASSFRSLIARDPEFIHNVSEQGRRSLPIRSRR
jgi:hypothetical protein